MREIEQNMAENMGTKTSEDTPWKLYIKECKRLVKIVYGYK